MYGYRLVMSHCLPAGLRGPSKSSTVHPTDGKLVRCSIPTRSFYTHRRLRTPLLTDGRPGGGAEELTAAAGKHNERCVCPEKIYTYFKRMSYTSLSIHTIIYIYVYIVEEERVREREKRKNVILAGNCYPLIFNDCRRRLPSG